MQTYIHLYNVLRQNPRSDSYFVSEYMLTSPSRLEATIRKSCHCLCSKLFNFQADISSKLR